MRILKLSILNQLTGSPTETFLYINSTEILTILDTITGVATPCVAITMKNDTTGISNFRLDSTAVNVISQTLDDYIELNIVSAVPSELSIFARIENITGVYISGTGLSTIVTIGNGAVNCSNTVESVTATMLGNIIDV